MASGRHGSVRCALRAAPESVDAGIRPGCGVPGGWRTLGRGRWCWRRRRRRRRGPSDDCKQFRDAREREHERGSAAAAQRAARLNDGSDQRDHALRRHAAAQLRHLRHRAQGCARQAALGQTAPSADGRDAGRVLFREDDVGLYVVHLDSCSPCHHLLRASGLSARKLGHSAALSRVPCSHDPASHAPRSRVGGRRVRRQPRPGDPFPLLPPHILPLLHLRHPEHRPRCERAPVNPPNRPRLPIALASDGAGDGPPSRDPLQRLRLRRALGLRGG
mmetsp:Transcript_46825/g.110233  ORF Transcript_46825/g.110233 Transcript_46825/m.110233 type:complete len:275 (-) Transcript_46825:1499-2323(-)